MAKDCELFNDYDFLAGINLLTGNELKVYMALKWDKTITYTDIHMDRRTFMNAYKHLYDLGLVEKHWKLYLVDVQEARLAKRREELQASGLMGSK